MIDRHLLGIAVLTIAALLVAGCGGGTDEFASDDGTATLSGTVYTTGASTAQSGSGQNQVPVPDCQMIVERVRDRVQLKAGYTDEQGQYRFEGLQQGQEIKVQAQLRNGERLMNQLQLRNRTHQADVTPDTTMAAACRQLAADGADPDDPDIDEIKDAVTEVCFQYQHQHGFQWRPGQAGPPDFADDAQVRHAAGELLRAATNDAVAAAIQNRGHDQCLRAVNMISAWLRHAGGDVPAWAAAARIRLANALRQGITVDADAVAAAVSSVTGQQVAAGDVEAARDRLRTQLQAFDGADPNMECVEAIAAMCMGDGTPDAVRLTERVQVAECARLLTE